MGVEAGVDAPALTRSYWRAQRSDRIEEITVGEALRRAAEDAADVVALVEGVVDAGQRRRWTYADVFAEAERAARALLDRLEPGARIAVWANNIPEWVLLEYGAALAGMTIVTVNPALRAAELRHVLGQSRADAIFLLDDYRGASLIDTLGGILDELPYLRHVNRFAAWDEFMGEATHRTSLPRVRPQDPAQVQYTSGTTGVPKGAVLHHRGIVNNARLFAERFELQREHALLSPMPLFHTAGCVMSVLGPLALRGTLVLPPAFDPALCLALIESERANSLMGVPTMLLAIMDHERLAATDVSSLRRVLSGGAVVSPELVRRVESTFAATCTVVFAQTEASPVITQTQPDDSSDDRAGTVGRPLPCSEVKIEDPTTHETLPIGEVGEVCTRGYHVMTGYLDRPDMTAAAIDADGWLHTGDLGSMDSRGYVRIEGRLKDMIIRGGENIYPREIEDVLIAHPDVADAAVIGVPDPRWGEQVAAFIRATPEAMPSEDALLAFCRERLAAHKAPRHWAFVDTFPITGSGKVQKHVLREQYLAARDEANE
jgi:fatty-acyl-CoA synthase